MTIHLLLPLLSILKLQSASESHEKKEVIKSLTKLLTEKPNWATFPTTYLNRMYLRLSDEEDAQKRFQKSEMLTIWKKKPRTSMNAHKTWGKQPRTWNSRTRRHQTRGRRWRVAKCNVVEEGDGGEGERVCETKCAGGKEFGVLSYE